MKKSTATTIEYGKLSVYAKWIGVSNKDEWLAYHKENGFPCWVPEDLESHFQARNHWYGWAHFMDKRH